MATVGLGTIGFPGTADQQTAYPQIAQITVIMPCWARNGNGLLTTLRAEMPDASEAAGWQVGFACRLRRL
jgi:hypothetical protein